MKQKLLSAILIASGYIFLSSEPINYSDMNRTLSDLTLTILYDNYTFNPELESDWGFSCLIEGLEKTILFDTGTKGKILMSNMKKMEKDPADIDIVVLSHIHQDHTGGMELFLDMNNKVKVYLPVSFPADFKKMIRDKGATITEVSGPVEIIKGVKTTGEMGVEIIEQSLVIDTEKGSMIITGCAHPGIVDIVKKSAEISGSKILIAMGGFHLIRTGENKINEIIGVFREMGINYAAPSHCSGDKTLEMFKTSYGDHFVGLGVGKVLKLSDL
jgi:7,8-dihydropterin-6-yl-methyl-4-(beta-D-ribofuranosyl)aminobenzene 5'-phosphate synthase